MSDDLIFREVDEDVRRERMEAAWKRYGGLALGGALLIVAIVAGSVFWKDYEKSSREEQGARFEAARSLLVEERYAEAAAAFEALAADAGDGYRLLADLRAAEARALAGESDAALSAYQRMLQASVGDEGTADVIRMKAALLALETQGAEAAMAQLGDLAERDGPFRSAAREIKAAALLAKGDREAALTELRAIAEDQAATQLQRERINRFILSLGG